MEFDLETIMGQYPLPDDVEDRIVNRGQCAKALGVSEPIINRYMDKGMPVTSRGSNGTAYEFQISECYAWKRFYDEGQRKEREAGDRAAAQLALLFRNEDADDAGAAGTLSLDEVAKQSEAMYRYDRAREQRGELVRRDRVEALFEDILIQFRLQITTLVDWCELEFGLTADQAEKMQARCSTTLAQTREGLSAQLPSDVAAINGAPDQGGLAL